MNPNLDRQPRQPPGRWPYPGDSPLTRARKIALMYRAALGAANPNLRDECDATAAAYGETWVAPRLATHNDNDWLNPRDAADYLCTSPDNIRRLRLAGRLAGTHTPKGWRYKVADLRQLEQQPRTRQRTKVDHEQA